MIDIRKEIRRALLVCLPYFVIVFFLDDLNRLFFTIHSRLGNPLLVVYMYIATVIIIALFIHTLIDLRDNYKNFGFKANLAMLIYLISLVNSFWSPLRISSDIFHSKIEFRAFRREKYGHDKMKLRENGTMDISYPGPFGMAGWEYGKWSKRGDTFYLNYDKNIDTVYVKPDTLIISEGLMTPIGIPVDTLNRYKDRFFRMAISSKK